MNAEMKNTAHNRPAQTQDISQAVIFDGQGAQNPGMGREFYEKSAVFRQSLDECLEIINRHDLKTLMFEGPAQELKKTSNVQPAMAAYCEAVIEMVSAMDLPKEYFAKDGMPNVGKGVSYAAGLSLGEYCALRYAGVINRQALMKIIEFRGRVMEEAASKVDYLMSAIIGLAPIQVESCIKDVPSTLGTVEISNRNATGQTVIAGQRAAVERAEALAKSAGAKRCIRLNTGGPFHTSLMKGAAQKLGMFLKNFEFKKPRIPVLSNVTGTFITDGDDIISLLERQTMSCVMMEDIILNLEAAGVRDIMEIGPAATIRGLVRRTAPQIKVYGISDLKKE